MPHPPFLPQPFNFRHLFLFFFFYNFPNCPHTGDSRNTRLLTKVSWFSKSESSKVLAPLLLGGQVHVEKEESALETKVESVEDPDITREEKLRGQNELAQRGL